MQLFVGKVVNHVGGEACFMMRYAAYIITTEEPWYKLKMRVWSTFRYFASSFPGMKLKTLDSTIFSEPGRYNEKDKLQK